MKIVETQERQLPRSSGAVTGDESYVVVLQKREENVPARVK